jgi:hypothetical protein
VCGKIITVAFILVMKSNSEIWAWADSAQIEQVLQNKKYEVRGW